MPTPVLRMSNVNLGGADTQALVVNITTASPKMRPTGQLRHIAQMSNIKGSVGSISDMPNVRGAKET
jgi:hypothetical protein